MIENGRVWSSYQQDIFKDISKGNGHTIIIARAGASKTSVLVEGAKYIPKGKKSLFCAFNKSIQEELKCKLPSFVECLTLHSLGLRGIKLKFGNTIEIDSNKCWKIVEELVGNEKNNFDVINNICKTVNFCKHDLVDTPSKIDDLIIEREIDLCDLNAQQFIHYVCQTLRLCKEKTSSIDFTDMIWFPFVYNINVGKYDNVFSDESQDFSKSMIELSLSAVRTNGRVIAVLDPRQCVDEYTIIQTENGNIFMKNINIGDKILSFRNGKIEFAPVINKIKSNWTSGIKITTKSGKQLTMSPNHRIWAEQPEVDGKFLVYLTYRHNIGFRIGKTNKWKLDTNDSRDQYENADKLWIIDIVNSNKEAISLEKIYSLKYSIPTSFFNGNNGIKFLYDKYLSFDYPHWIRRNSSGSKNTNRLIRVSAHGIKNTSVGFEFSDQQTLEIIKKHNIKYSEYKMRTTDLSHFVVERWFADYSDASLFAQTLSNLVDGNITETLSFDKESDFRLITASGLFTGMKVLSKDNDVLFADEITNIDLVDGSFYDIEVDKNNNFIGNDILSHNCIYSWRGADSRVLDNLKSRLNPKELMLPICYRCPKKVVELIQNIVPDIQPYENAIDGEITDLPVNELINHAKPGSYVLSRYNAPLIKHCLMFIKNNKPANILGKDIGEGLVGIIKKSKKKKIIELLKWLSQWEQNEKDKLIAKHPKANTDSVIDKAECIRMFCENASNVGEVVENIKKMFKDSEEKNIKIGRA